MPLPVSTATLLQIAGGTFIAGTAVIYFGQKRLQSRVRSLPQYKETLAIVKEHQLACSKLGPPIQIGEVDLADRRSNYVAENESKLRIPVTGRIGAGYLNVTARRDDKESKFQTERVELEVDDGVFTEASTPVFVRNLGFTRFYQVACLRHMFSNHLLDELSAMSWPEWLQPHVDAFVQWVNEVLEYWDLQYLEWLLWLFLPIFVAFVLPIFLLFFIYGCVIFLHIYGLRNRIREAYASSYWDGARTSIASFWDAVGSLWHGYEATGLDYIPDEGPALFVAYHGTLPLDIYYLIAKGILYKKRTIHCVADKFVFKIPGWGQICKVFCMTPGTVQDCVTNLKAGNLLIIAPGGVREALFSNADSYQIMWGRRLGFANVVLGSGTPVIPMFTENCRDAFRTPAWGRKLFRGLYERTRAPLCPIYGGFPVKMITHLGPPLRFEEGTSPEQIKHLVANLIREHQRLPGNILHAMAQRFRNKAKKPSARYDPEPNGNCFHPSPQETRFSLARSGNDLETSPLRGEEGNSSSDEADADGLRAPEEKAVSDDLPLS
ncbi:Cytochrome oxidase assembly protein 1 [Aphelenchoides avenae]|nr:Cytochrome oxidase assembly protein 1 [Aphelenchus avenae]